MQMAQTRAAHPELAEASDQRMGKLKQLRSAEAQRVEMILANDRPPPPPKKKGKGPVQPKPLEPTPEWRARYDHQQVSPTNASGQKIGGRPYLRRPWYESLFDRDDALAKPLFSEGARKAVELYRANAEMAERSETKCSLASLLPRPGGRSDGPSDSIARAKDHIRWAEALMGPFVQTVRAVAIDDMPYEQVAMARFGSRDVEYFDAETGALSFKPRPRSGRHTQRIREEFVAGVKLLTAAGRAAPVSVGPVVKRTEPEPRSERPISDAICLALLGKEAVGIAASLTVAQAIIRENGGKAVFGFEPHEFDHDTHEIAFGGLPVTVKPGWVWGAWMVLAE